MLAAILGLFGLLLAAVGGRGGSSSATAGATLGASETPKENGDSQPTPPSEVVVTAPQPVTPTTEPAITDGTPPETTDPVTVTSPGTNTQIVVAGGRVTTIELDATKAIQSVKITDNPAHGNATVNPDNSIALVLSGDDYSGDLDLTYEITYEDGSKASANLDMNVTAPSHDAGWGQGKHYMLEEDENGDLIIETGENHRKVYVSESDDALSRADIAALEGLNVDDITREWLAEHDEYGASEDTPVDTDVAMSIWFEINRPDDGSHTSNWLMFERGYTYDDADEIIIPKSSGEDELHPIHITSWGDGEQPIITNKISILNFETSNMVFSDLTLTGGLLGLTGSDIIFHDVRFTDEGLNIQHGARYTLHDSEVVHVANDKDPDAEIWSGTRAGLFSRDIDGWLIEGTIFHHNGWEDDYHDDWSTEGGMPPNALSHNVYLQNDTTDVTFRDNITAEGSSYGAHIRGGGYVEDNLFLDNNNAVDLLGGVYAGDDAIGNFTFFADNVITSGAHKKTDFSNGGVTRGLTNDAFDTTLLDNIIAHLTNPDDPSELDWKLRTNYAFGGSGTTEYDDTIVYNWKGGTAASYEPGHENKNVDDIDTSAADATTIQRFAATLMGTETATIRELMDYLVALSQTEFDDQVKVDQIIDYFQAGFGIAPNGSDAATDHRFVPNNLADGVRWDNRINWDTEDVPDNGDNVDLGGNWVQYGGTTTLGDLDMGSGGKLDVNYGRLTVDGDLTVGTDGAQVTTIGAGQFWTNGYAGSDRLQVHVDGGRFANTGDFTGKASIDVTDGQAILATDNAKMVLGAESELRISSTDPHVGFDGADNDTAILQMADDATLTFSSGATGFGTIEEFRSGKWGDQDEANVKSGVSLDGTLQVDLSNYSGGVAEHTLIKVDALDGILDDIHVFGLDSNLNATVVTDYETDELRLEITSGSGQVAYNEVGNAGDEAGEAADLWAALTAGHGTYDNTQPSLHDEGDMALPELLIA